MATRWQDLIVTDAEGNTGETLSSLLNAAPANMDDLVLADDGSVKEWPGFFLNAPDEDPQWDTPQGEVDWTGFSEALRRARS